MKPYKIDVPVVFTIFNRPNTTAEVFAEIKKARPSKLFVIADGPRKNKIGEFEKCRQARAILEDIDWDCQVYKNYSDINLGCKMRISTGISWVFENVEEAIILEDDCLPEQSFFTYCQNLLQKYRLDNSIAIISGNNLLFEKQLVESSYYFSKISNIWGWATWKRTWDLYDVNMTDWYIYRNKKIFIELTRDQWIQKYMTMAFDETYYGKINTWDYQLQFTVLKKNLLCIAPSKNLVKNIGFSQDATHTTSENSVLSELETHPMNFPLIAPNSIRQDEFFDELELELSKIGLKHKLPFFIYKTLRKFRCFINTYKR